MPLNPQQLQQAAQNFLTQGPPKKPAEFGVPKTQEQRLNEMPNADKLTKTERGIYGALPGITTWMENHRFMGGTVSEQLDKFNNSWAGKALNKLDVLAEGLERTVGLVGQLDDPDFDIKDLQSAWYAGSLTYDTTNLPVFKRDEAGKVIGMTIPTDLPGSGGVSEARAKIQKYIDIGLSPKEALDRARDDLYGGLGALALRAQLNDTYGHVLLDPLNFLTGALKPVQALKARRFAALSGKLTGGVEEILQSANKAGDLLKAAGNTEDALKYADEAFRLAQMAGDTKLAAQYGEQAAQIAKGLGKAEDVGKYTAETARLAGMGAEEAAMYSEDALKLLGKKQLTSLDKFAIMMTGGDPFRPSKIGTALEKVPILGVVAKQFQLTPASKAQEVLNLVSNNINHTIGRMINDADGVEKFTGYMRRLKKGATGIEYGHGMMTLEGRTVQSFVTGGDFDVERMFANFQELAPTRGRLEMITQTLGESPEKLMRLMDENPESVMQMLVKHADANPNLALAIQSGELTPDALKAISKTLKDVPYNNEMFFAQTLDAVETAAMRQAVVQFGVQAKGVMTRWSDAVKAAESLAFLKLNPGYPIRNMVNNEVTMLARGVFGVFGADDIDNFWSDFGMIPKRLGEALTPAGEAAKRGATKMSEAQRVLEDALRGGQWGAPDKAKEFFQKLNVGKLDSTKWGFKGKTFEEMAGRRAMTVGTQQGLDMYLPEVRIQNHLAPKLLDEMDNAVAGLSAKINGAIRSSNGSAKKLKNIMGQNLNVSVDNILDDVTAKLGTDVREMLGTEVVAALKNKLPDAIAGGKLDAFKFEMRQQINKHIDDLFNKQIDNVVEHTKAQAVAGGPNVWNKKMLEAREMFYGARIEHSVRMPEATRLAREAASVGDFKAADALWRQEAEDARLFYDRAFRRVDAMIEGLEQGTQELTKRGAKLPFAETKKTFREFKAGWEDFFKTKNKMFEDYWALPKDKRPKWDDFHAQTEELFKAQVKREEDLTMRLDDTIAGMIDDPAAKQAYMNARDALSELDRADKAEVVNMFEKVNKLPKEERPAAWNEFWAVRQQRLQEMRSVDAASIMIQQGDQNAMAQFSQAAPRLAQEAAGTEAKSVYAIADEFGIPSASPSGARMDKRILATVNKYAPKEEAAKAVEAGAETAGKKLDDVVDLPRDELPLEVSDKIASEAKSLSRELFEGEAGKRIFTKDIEGGAEVRKVIGQSSTNTDWYRELYAKGLRKPTIDKAIDKIIQDAGADKGVNVERVKEIILNRFKNGDPDQGIPPDLNALKALDADDKTMQEALDTFNDITKQDVSLDEAIRQSGGKVDELTPDVNKPYYDEAGNLVKPQKGRYSKVSDIPPDVARKAFEARATAKGTQIPAKAVEGAINPAFIADVNKVVPNPQPLDFSMDLMAYGRQYGTLDEIVDGAKIAAKKTPMILDDLPPALKAQAMRALEGVENDLAGVRYKAMKFGEWRRDSALLNYNRRTNFDNNLAHIAPFAFWSTSSMMQWAIESIDRPAMLTNYLRAKKFLATAGMERDGMATRTKGKIRVNLPFAPEWMGEQFIDPLRLALPFDNWASPFEQFQKDQDGADGRTERLLEQMLQEGKIDQAEFDEAIGERAGATWDQAEALQMQNEQGDRYDAWDFGTALASPHAPIMWAYNAAFGDKEDIGPFSPLSRIMRNAATQMGVEDWNNSKYNLEAKIRRQMGLNSYDKWDDYRIDRALSDLAGDGSYTPDEVKEAMAVSAMVQAGRMTPEQAKQQSEAYREGVKRSNQEFTGGGAAFALGLLGISVTSVPQGENNLRMLQDDFGNAYEKYKKSNDSLEAYLAAHRNMDEQEAAEAWAKANPALDKDGDALTDFFNEHPEYETRLGLFDPPEEKIHKFMIDQVWKKFNEMPKVNQDEIREHLGEDFQNAFMNKETRSYDDIPTELMSVWLKMMGTDPLGGLTADQRVLTSLYGTVQYTDPETANRVQVFYDTRKNDHADFYKLQSGYYELDKSKRKAYLAQHPDLKQYWTFRTNFMRDNPDLVPYLTDDEKAIARAKNKVRDPGVAVPTAQEIRINTPPEVQELLYDFFQNGEQLPSSVMNELEYMGGQYNMTAEQMLNVIGGGQYGVP